MKNITELRNQLAEVFTELRNGTAEAKNVSELANIAGKMINSAKVQLEYHALKGDQPNIPFLEK